MNRNRVVPSTASVRCRLSPVRMAAAAVALVGGLCLERQAAANLCNPQGKETDRASEEVPLMEAETFAQSVSDGVGTYDFKGDRSYNIMVLACNRKRDTLANNLEKAIPANKTFANDLPPKIVRGHYRYLSYQPGLRYGYQLRREKGVWKVTIPLDLRMPTAKMTDMIDIPEELSMELGLNASGKACDPRGTKFRDGDSTKEVLSGYVPERSDGDPGKRNGAMYAPACRVKRSTSATTSWSGGKQNMPNLLKRWWQKRIKDVWNRPGFEVEPILVDLDKPTAAQMAAWEKDEIVWRPQLNMITYHRPTYKRWSLKFWTQMYSGVPTDVFAHEAGHVVGLDDEYNESGEDECRSYIQQGYIMCDADTFAEARKGAKAIYAWIATRRYGVAEAPQCKENSDCGAGFYCAKNGLGRNVCEERRGPCDKCSADDQCDTGMTCIGKPAGHCAQRASVSVGDDCCANDQCKSGKCNGDNVCECSEDGQCPSGFYCAEPAFAPNTCEAKAGECGACSNDGECKSGKCASGRCVTASALAVGAACCRDTQCRSGSCNASGVCQCKQDGDCPAGRYCADHGLNANSCDAAKAICATCANDSQCGSGAKCKGVIGFQKCIKENVLAIGAVCCMDAQCGSNKCEKDRCVCRQDSDCPRNQKCKTPITGQNHCE